MGKHTSEESKRKAKMSCPCAKKAAKFIASVAADEADNLGDTDEDETYSISSDEL